MTAPDPHRLSAGTDEDYDLDAMAIADGGRPPDVTLSHRRIRSGTSQHYHDPFRGSPPPRPSSTTKPRVGSFALRHDGSTSPAVVSDARAAPAPNTTPTRSS